jgi:tol-pal system protein YbgF
VSPRTLLILFLFAAGLLSSACLTADQISSLERDVSDVRVQVEKLRAEQSKFAEQVSDLQARYDGAVEGDQEWRADIDLRLRTLEERITILGEQSDQAARRAESLVSEIAALRAALYSRPSPPPPSTGVPSAPSEVLPGTGAPGTGAQELFNAAYADYSKGNYPLATQGFEEYLRNYGDTGLADNARYWIGVCHYDSGDFEKAIDEFDRLLKDYPDGDKVPGAHLKKGLAYLEMNRISQGVVQLQHLIERYPNSDEARVARERLKSKGVPVD